MYNVGIILPFLSIVMDITTLIHYVTYIVNFLQLFKIELYNFILLYLIQIKR